MHYNWLFRWLNYSNRKNKFELEIKLVWYLKIIQFSSSCCRWPAQPPEPVQQPATAEEEAQISNGVHKSPDLRAGEEVPVPEVPLASGSGRDRRSVRPHQRPGHHVVPEQTGQAQTGHGGAQERRGVHEGEVWIQP